MADRETMLDTIDSIYAARVSGDKAALAPFWASGATFRLNGAETVLRGVPAEPVDAITAVEALIDQFRFHALERLDAVVEGNKAAIRWRLVVSAGEKEERVTTELYDLWTLDEAGRVLSLVQFADTALIARMLA